MKYLVVDGALHGTGIRDYYEGGYINLESLGLERDLIVRIRAWLSRYENEHYNSFEDLEEICNLDEEGREIAILVKKQIAGVKVDYYSAAKLTRSSIN